MHGVRACRQTQSPCCQGNDYLTIHSAALCRHALANWKHSSLVFPDDFEDVLPAHENGNPRAGFSLGPASRNRITASRMPSGSRAFWMPLSISWPKKKFLAK